MEAYSELPQSVLDERVCHLQEQLTLPLNEERKQQLGRELAHVLFEVECRLKDAGAVVL